jgi:hypothetical protein
VQVPPRFLIRCRDPHHAPNLPSTPGDSVEAIGLGTAFAPAHLNARRIDDLALDSVRHEEAVQPEAVAAS